MSDDEEVQVIKPPSTLKAKVGTGGPGAVDLETLERAEAVIASSLMDERGTNGFHKASGTR